MSYWLEQQLRRAVEAQVKSRYDVTPKIVLENPPKPEMGEFALPVAFELARKLKRPPPQIAKELAAELTLPTGFDRAVAVGGYLNFFVDRGAALAAALAGSDHGAARIEGKVVVEHTNINPNKAAHIGHLRNAVLGDTWVRLLRHRGEQVEVQNYIDNTGVQVADVVAAFLHLPSAAGLNLEAAIAAGTPPFDYRCWDLYAEISQHYEREPESLAWRQEVLHAIEAGDNATSALAARIAEAIVHAHLRTMDRLHVRYDVLPAESEILHLHFWTHAFALLQEQGAVRLETEGKNAGCWVMDRAGAAPEGEDGAKVIVRSNGIVTYVGKDIAYQMWKFGLLPLDFGYRRFHQYPDGKTVWSSALTPDAEAPRFGHAAWVFNVIDVRQSYLQDVVTAGLRALGHPEAAERSVHFSYEMVALSPACVAALGYVNAEDKRMDVSGRKGVGVKADDLIDLLVANAQVEVDQRHPDLSLKERSRIAYQIAICALRFFLLKFTRTTLIAFDFKEALSFEGETGPYVQYAAVRAGNILRKAGREPGAATQSPPATALIEEPEVWGLIWLAARLESVVEQAIEAREPAHAAKYAFQLAQVFSNFYHHYPVLQEKDAERREFLLAVVALVRRQLVTALDLMGIETPEAM